MVSNRMWRLARRWLLTTLATAVITRWLRYALEDRPRMRRAHATEEEVGLSAARYARFMQRWPLAAIYRRIALLTGQRLGAADSDSGRPLRVLDVGCGPGDAGHRHRCGATGRHGDCPGPLGCHAARRTPAAARQPCLPHSR